MISHCKMRITVPRTVQLYVLPLYDKITRCVWEAHGGMLLYIHDNMLNVCVDVNYIDSATKPCHIYN